MGVSEISGRFNQFKGELHFNANSSVIELLEVKIETASIDSGNTMRDGHLRGSDFFQSAQFPFITFKSKSISQLKPGHYKAIGKMTVRGVIRTATILFSMTEALKDTWGYENKFVKFESKISRDDYQLKWNKTLGDQKFLVGNEVSFMGIFQLQPMSHVTPTSKHMIPDTSYIRNRERILRGEIKDEKSDFKLVKKIELNGPLVNIEAKPDILQVPVVTAPDFRKSRMWWMAFSIIGLLGFFGVLLVCYYSKSKIAESFPIKYEENGLLGYLSDSIVIVMVSIYAVALWFLGWGIR